MMKSQSKITINSCFLSLGAVLSLIGMQLNAALMNVGLGDNYVSLIMSISVLFLISYKNISYLLSFPRKVLPLLFLLIIFLVYFPFSENLNEKFFNYILYTIVICLVLNTHRREVLLMEKSFFPLLFFISFFISIVCASQSSFGSYRMVESASDDADRLFLQGGGDPITMARALVINIISICFYRPKYRFGNILKTISCIFSVVGLLSFFTRSAVFYAILIPMLFLWNLGQDSSVKKIYVKGYIKHKKYFIFFIVFVMFVICYMQIPFFAEKIDTIFDKMYRGILSFLGLNSGVNVDLSAQGRTNVREIAYNKMLLSMDIKTIFLGNGLNYIFLDSPALQIFFDCGFFIGLLYIYYTVWLPLKINFKKTSDSMLLCFKLIAVIYCFDQFTCGWPYFYMNFLPILFYIYRAKTINKMSNKVNKQ